MICVSIGRGRHRMMMAEHKHLAEQGAQLVELRLDYIRRSVNISRLLGDRHCPVITTCRRPHERGKWMRSEDDRLVLLRTAIANGADYIDLESDIAGKIPRYGDTKRIISYHNFHETPEDLEAIYDMMCRLDPDIIKIATMANNPIDNFRTLRLCRKKRFPTVAFCMGEMGLPSRVLCGKFGAPFTYATFNTERIMAPGQLTRDQLIEDYRYENLNQDTQILGVIADPVAHSLSPAIHNACLREHELNMLYLPFRVPAEYLDEFMSSARELDIKGLSVTIPHKEAVLKHINALDDLSGGIKATNTIVFRGQGTRGYNTDCQAALDSLAAVLPQNDDGRPFAGKRVLILGSGGVARTIGFGLHREGAKVVICTRDYRKADALATELQCKSMDWAGRANAEYDVLINATPVGMHPNLDESPMEAKWFERNTIVFDTVYNPEQTLFIKRARAADCITVTGVDMFMRQAAEQFRLFTGKPANQDLIREMIKKSISAARYSTTPDDDEVILATDPKKNLRRAIFLTGYRAVGKSTVGKRLARKLGAHWHDTDALVESRERKTIEEIFEKGGETAFRRMELSAIKSLVDSFTENENSIVSLGGGAILSQEVRELIAEKGRCVWLAAPPELIIKRIKAAQKTGQARPPLTDLDLEQEVTQVLAKRTPVYADFADYKVDVQGLTVDEVVELIAQWRSPDDTNH